MGVVYTRVGFVIPSEANLTVQGVGTLSALTVQSHRDIGSEITRGSI